MIDTRSYHRRSGGLHRCHGSMHRGLFRRRAYVPAILAGIVAGWLPAAVPGGVARDPDPDPARIDRVTQIIDTLCRTPHRLAGTPEGRAAGDAILHQLRLNGVPDDAIMVQPFDLVQLTLDPADCYFEHQGRRVPMQPLRPNGLALPVTPADGLDGATVYLGDGHWDHFNDTIIDGRIAVLDYHSGDRWTRAVAAGARAVVFVGADASLDHPVLDQSGGKSFHAHLEIPRFFVSAETARRYGLLSGARIRLFSRMGFRRAEGRNIIVAIPGMAGDRPNDHALVLATSYDTFGTLPFATRDPVRAANVAGLIEAAAEFSRTPPERPLRIIFFDNEAQQQAGQYRFHFMRDAARIYEGPGSLRGMLDDRAAENAFLRHRLAAIRDPAALITGSRDTVGADGAREAVHRAVETIYNQRVTDLSDARSEVNLLDHRIDRLRLQLRRLEAEAASTGGMADQVNALGRELRAAEAARDRTRADAVARLEKAERARDIVYQLRVRLTAGHMPDPEGDSAIQSLFDVLMEQVRDGWQARLAEQVRETEHLQNDQRLADRLADPMPVAMVFWNLLPSAHRWAVQGPAEDNPRALSNPHVIRWLRETPPGTWDRSAGYVAGVPSRAAAGVSGRTAFVLELANPGAVPAVPAAPDELTPDAAAFVRSLDGAIDFCRQLAGLPELGRTRIPPRFDTVLAFNVPSWSGSRYDGSFVRHYDERFIAGDNAVDAVVMALDRNRLGQPPPFDGWGAHLTISSKIGTYSLLTPRESRLVIEAARHDERGFLEAISLRQPGGGPGSAGSWELAGWYFADGRNQVLLGDIVSRIMLAGIRTPFGRTTETAIRFIDALTESAPKQMNLSLGGDLVAVYTGRLRQYKVLHGAQLLLGNSPADPTGGGYAVEPGVVDALSRSARETWILNESRLDRLRRHNIMEHALERLHARAERLLEDATHAPVAPGLAVARHQASLGYSARVYQPVRDVTNDLVNAVVILLLLAIPFAFAFERAVIGTPNIYLQILGFAIVFGIVFVILFLVHPAFRFVSFPIIVLLAFVIIIMSSVVIVIMWSKFEYEVRKLHGLATASHQSTRTARGLIGAAVALGIATMRRRPLRSVLTAVTIILLTFTILFFGSFRSEDGVRTIYVGPGPRQPVVEIGSVPGSAFDPQVVAMFRQLYGDVAVSYARGWSVPDQNQVLAGRLPDDTVFSAGGQATLPPGDLDQYPELRELLRGDLDGFVADGGIFLPPEIHRLAGDEARTGAAIEFAGRRYVLRGTFDPARLGAMRTLDGASFVPPNLAEVQRQLEQEYPNDPLAVRLRLDEMELEDYPPVDPETVVLIWEPRAAEQDLPVRSLVFLPQTETQARAMAGDIATQLSRRASFAAGGEHYRALYASQLTLGGFAQVAVPLILGGLIIFGTMLSSVSDRQREIFTFSALGLGPRHVATLFFAEAAVYSVVGGMGGYLFAHIFAKLVEWMAIQGWVSAPMMNHSSMNAMLTLLLVMATVLASTLYPALQASRSANPGAQRQWRMPDPDGDRLQMEFPFTVSDYDMIGLVSFLEEYLLAHREKSVGLFAADQVAVRFDESRFILSATVWLQPFDQGLSQTFKLWTQPSQIEGIDQVRVEMLRLSGSPGIWRRSIRVFIHELRNQFILWRTIPDDAADHYHRMTASRFALPEPGSDP